MKPTVGGSIWFPKNAQVPNFALPHLFCSGFPAEQTSTEWARLAVMLGTERGNRAAPPPPAWRSRDAPRVPPQAQAKSM